MKELQVDLPHLLSAEESEYCDSHTPIPCSSRASSPCYTHGTSLSSTWTSPISSGWSRHSTPSSNCPFEHPAESSSPEVNTEMTCPWTPLSSNRQLLEAFAESALGAFSQTMPIRELNPEFQLMAPALFISDTGQTPSPYWLDPVPPAYQMAMVSDPPHSSQSASPFRVDTLPDPRLSINHLLDPRLDDGSRSACAEFPEENTVKLEDVTEDRPDSDSESSLSSLEESLPEEDEIVEIEPNKKKNWGGYRRRERRKRYTPPGQQPEPKVKIVCPICKNEFSRKHNLVTHMKLHDPGRKRYGCDYCDMTFSRATDSGRHVITIHKRSPRHRCVCGRWFPRNDSLKRHLESKGYGEHRRAPRDERVPTRTWDRRDVIKKRNDEPATS